jgi:hypothetical protein
MIIKQKILLNISSNNKLTKKEKQAFSFSLKGKKKETDKKLTNSQISHDAFIIIESNHKIVVVIPSEKLLTNL